MRKSTRIARKYGRFGRFPVYNTEPETEPLDVCFGGSYKADRVSKEHTHDYDEWMICVDEEFITG